MFRSQHDHTIIYFYRLISPRAGEKSLGFFPTESGRNGQATKIKRSNYYKGCILEVGVWTPIGETITKTETL